MSAAGSGSRVSGAPHESKTSSDNGPAPGDFGANEWLVEELYQRYLADPSSVDRAWWSFFADYTPSLTNGTGPQPVISASRPAPAAPAQANGSARPAAAAAPPRVSQAPPAAAAPPAQAAPPAAQAAPPAQAPPP